MNRGGNRVVLDGRDSFMENKMTKKRTKVHYEDGQYVLYLWAPVSAKEVEKTKSRTEAASNGYAIPATDEEPGFTRPVRV